MFADSSWFDTAPNQRVPKPVQRQGWMAYGIWACVAIVPLFLLVLRGQWPEMAIWLLVVAGMFAWEMRGLKREIRRRHRVSQMHFIGDALPLDDDV